MAMAFDDRADPGTEEKAGTKRLRISEILQRPFDVRSIALTGLFILGVFYTMYFMRAMLLPLVLALLLSYLLGPLVRVLAMIRIPAFLGAAIVLFALPAFQSPRPDGSRKRPIVCSSSNKSCCR
jgi:hypothetical protein